MGPTVRGFGLLLLIAAFVHSEKGCLLNGVCACSKESCSPPLKPVLASDVSSKKALLYSTTESGKRLEKQTIKMRRTSKSSGEEVIIRVNQSELYQVIMGFGGAMTDAAAINIDLLSKDLREQLLQAYFGPEGIGYTFVRIPIASCDFSTREYSYVERDGDFGLEGFALADEDEKKIRHTKRAKAIAASDKRALRVFGSPWSAPAWMKANGRMKGGGSIREGNQYQESYAKYLAKFADTYAGNGVPIWGMTLQNEPSTGEDPDYAFQTMYMSPEMQGTFVRDFLKPALITSVASKNVALMIFDDFRPNLPEWPDKTLADPEIDAMIDGIAVHWYGDGADPDLLDTTKERHPKQFILGTEACFTDTHGVTLGNVTRGLLYARDIIEDLTHSVTGWVDWNMVLDLQGGPNWVQNFADAPVIVDAEKKTFYKQPMFYAMGHFSRFMQPGANRVGATVDGPGTMGGPQVVAVENPDGSVAVAILNESERQISMALTDGKRSASFLVERRSINTAIFYTQKQ